MKHGVLGDCGYSSAQEREGRTKGEREEGKEGKAGAGGIMTSRSGTGSSICVFPMLSAIQLPLHYIPVSFTAEHVYLVP